MKVHHKADFPIQRSWLENAGVVAAELRSGANAGNLYRSCHTTVEGLLH